MRVRYWKVAVIRADCALTSQQAARVNGSRHKLTPVRPTRLFGAFYQDLLL
jgi:hypothetical protein